MSGILGAYFRHLACVCAPRPTLVGAALEPTGGELPAPLEIGVRIDSSDEAHGERMREKARRGAERSVGFAPGDGRL